MLSHDRQKIERRAFSLIELLTVIAILAALAVAAQPMMSSLNGAGKTTKNLIVLSNVLERAREFAISHNTFTWVALQNPAGSGLQHSVALVAFASTDGTSAAASSNAAIPNDALVPLDRPYYLDNCLIESDQNLSSMPVKDNLPQPSSGSFLRSDVSFDYQSESIKAVTGSSAPFRYSVMFTPSGEARVTAGGVPDVVQLVLVPMKGGTVRDNAAASVVRVAGLTGRIKVYRP